MMDLRLLAVAAKDIKILLRDRMAFAMLLGMPIMLIVVLSFALKSQYEEGELTRWTSRSSTTMSLLNPSILTPTPDARQRA